MMNILNLTDEHKEQILHISKRFIRIMKKDFSAIDKDLNEMQGIAIKAYRPKLGLKTVVIRTNFENGIESVSIRGINKKNSFKAHNNNIAELTLAQEKSLGSKMSKITLFILDEFGEPKSLAYSKSIGLGIDGKNYIESLNKNGPAEITFDPYLVVGEGNQTVKIQDVNYFKEPHIKPNSDDGPHTISLFKNGKVRMEFDEQCILLKQITFDKVVELSNLNENCLTLDGYFTNSKSPEKNLENFLYKFRIYSEKLEREFIPCPSIICRSKSSKIHEKNLYNEHISLEIELNTT